MSDVEMKTPESVNILPVIETKCTRGAGTSANPVRLVTQYWSLDGKLLAEKDRFKQKLSLHPSHNKDSKDCEEICEEWIKDEILYKPHFRCPKCHSDATYFVGGTEDWWVVEKPNHCPKCGVKLK